MRMLVWTVLVGVLLAAAPGCAKKGSGAVAPSAGSPLRQTGVLRSGAVAIGGEHTGWTFQLEGSTASVEADVSQVSAAAAAGDGKRVYVTGTYADRRYVERGKTRVLVVTRIDPAPPR